MERPEQERRKYPRIGMERMIAVAHVEGRHLAQARDLSLGGIRFQIVGAEVSLDDVLRVFFNVEDQTFSAIGRVVWATELDAFTTDVGLEFLEVDPVASELLAKGDAA